MLQTHAFSKKLRCFPLISIALPVLLLKQKNSVLSPAFYLNSPISVGNSPSALNVSRGFRDSICDVK